MLIFFMSLIDDSYYREKFEEIYVLYKNQMFYMARGIVKNDDEAEDVVHTVFLKIAQNHIKTVAGINNPTDLRNYLLTAVKNTALNSIKSRNRLIMLEDVFYRDEDEFANDGEFVEYIMTRYEYEKVLDVIGGLNETYRDVLYLYFVLEMSVNEISIQLNRRVGTVKKQITRGKKIIVRKLEGETCFE